MAQIGHNFSHVSEVFQLDFFYQAALILSKWRILSAHVSRNMPTQQNILLVFFLIIFQSQSVIQTHLIILMLTYLNCQSTLCMLSYSIFILFILL